MIGRIGAGLALSVLAMSLVAAPRADALVRVDACGELTQARETYLVTKDLTSDDICFTVLADGITIDLGGHTIHGGPDNENGTAVFDDNLPLHSITVKNGRIEKFAFGIFLLESPRVTIRNVTVVDSEHSGIVVGDHALIKDCVVQGNGLDGINLHDHGQVQNCLVGGDPAAGGSTLDGNGRYGIVAGIQTLITQNTVGFNGSHGIFVGIRSTVTRNTSSENEEHGIAVGLKSLVSYNVADNNDRTGIEAVCPSTITHNEASGNLLNYDFINIGQGACFDKFNTSTGGGGPTLQ